MHTGGDAVALGLTREPAFFDDACDKRSEKRLLNNAKWKIRADLHISQ